MLLQVDADGVHVADDLLWRFFKGKEHAGVTSFAGRIEKAGSNAGFAGAGSTRYKYAAAYKIAFVAQHDIQCRDA